MMQELIDQYFVEHLSLSPKDAVMLHKKYYKEYGLALEGLVRYHSIDPLEYNRAVDDALPLDEIMAPDMQLRRLLEDLDKTAVKPWLFTNAYINHGKRVVRLLGVEDLFEGITYCDYAQPRLICKPHKEMFDKAEAEAGATSSSECYFVGMHATEIGKTSVAADRLKMIHSSTALLPRLVDGRQCTSWSPATRVPSPRRASISSEISRSCVSSSRISSSRRRERRRRRCDIG